MASKKTAKRKSTRLRQKARRTASQVDTGLVQDGRVGPSAQVSFSRQDLLRTPTTWMLTQVPPNSFKTDIVWTQINYGTTFATNAAAAYTEVNQAFALNSFANADGLKAYFDQYCIYAVTISIGFSAAASILGSGPNGNGYSCIDYDNVSNIGSGAAAAIQAFGSCESFIINEGNAHQRFIKPAVASNVYSASYGVARVWLNSTYDSVPHYGFRSVYFTPTSTSMSLNVTAIVGWRNNN
jgi:hypothetical protein